MAKINLLPWREQLRKERQQQFGVALIGVLVVGVLLIGGADRVLNAQIDNQTARNNFIKQEIKALDGRIQEIAELKERRAQLLERMKIIQDLQGNRPIIAHVFDQFVRTLPDGVYFTSLKMAGKKIDMNGVAESNSRVSTLMRNLDASEWLALPVLGQVKQAGKGMDEDASAFTLSVLQTQPGEVIEQVNPEPKGPKGKQARTKGKAAKGAQK
jgi:type IV pilus assembly protein PilN